MSDIQTQIDAILGPSYNHATLIDILRELGRAQHGLRGALGGLQLANNATDAANDIDIAPGSAMDEANRAEIMQLSGTLVKQIDAAWAVGSGAGGMDTGSVANNTWYHVHLIMRPDTYVVDALFSLSATAPTMPANYTRRRRIGSVRRLTATNRAFYHRGDFFGWKAASLDVDVTNPGTAAVLRTLLVPSGVIVEAAMNAVTVDSGSLARITYISSPDADDEAPSGTVAPLASFWSPAATNTGHALLRVLTNTSSQVRTRLNGSGANTSFRIATLGWYDRRGKDD